MFDHIGVRVKNLDASSRLYKAMLEPLCWVPGPAGEGYAGFGPKGKSPLWLHQDKKSSGCHLALKAPSKAAVDDFHARGVKAGAKDNGKPGLRTDYAPNYYAAFLTDL